MTVHSADQRGGQVPAPHTPQFAIAAAADDTMSEAELLDKLNTNVREMSDAEQAVAGLEWATESARQKLTACSREVGLQLLELKRQTRTVKAFEAALERVDGLKLSRAYVLMAVAEGRTTEEEQRTATARRVTKHRAAKKARPVSVTEARVTEAPEDSAAELYAGYNAAGRANGHDANGRIVTVNTAPTIITEMDGGKALAEFKLAVDTLYPKMSRDELREAHSTRSIGTTLCSVICCRPSGSRTEGAKK